MSILKRYSAGDISDREAAKEMGPDTTIHDVFLGTAQSGLILPAPSPGEIAAEVDALRTLYGPHGPRLKREFDK